MIKSKNLFRCKHIFVFTSVYISVTLHLAACSTQNTTIKSYSVVQKIPGKPDAITCEGNCNHSTPNKQEFQNPPSYDYAPLAWESVDASTRAWSEHLFQSITKRGAALFSGSTDIAEFCPQYKNLSNEQKTNFWGMLISAIAKYESKFDPTARMLESTMGTDPVTGEDVYSEGLLQLSYQDIRNFPSCEFNWELDKDLSPTDPRKTILNPYINLDCGVTILNSQIAKHRIIAAPAKFAYWAVLIPKGKYTKLDKIKSITKTLAFCNTKKSQDADSDNED